MNKRKWNNIERITDKQYLYDNLTQSQLRLIDNILDAYWNERIDFIPPRHKDGTVDFYVDFELIILDGSYKETGYELLVIKWAEDYEDTGYMVDCVSEYNIV